MLELLFCLARLPIFVASRPRLRPSVREGLARAWRRVSGSPHPVVSFSSTSERCGARAMRALPPFASFRIASRSNRSRSICINQQSAWLASAFAVSEGDASVLFLQPVFTGRQAELRRSSIVRCFQVSSKQTRCQVPISCTLFIFSEGAGEDRRSAGRDFLCGRGMVKSTLSINEGFFKVPVLFFKKFPFVCRRRVQVTCTRGAVANAFGRGADGGRRCRNGSPMLTSARSPPRCYLE